MAKNSFNIKDKQRYRETISEGEVNWNFSLRHCRKTVCIYMHTQLESTNINIASYTNLHISY